MCVTLIGGMDRLKSDYQNVARTDGHDLKIISRNAGNLEARIGHPDAILIFTNKISHEARNKTVQYAKSLGIPVHMVHSCGISALRQFFQEVS